MTGDCLFIVNSAAKLARRLDPTKLRLRIKDMGIRGEVTVTRRPDEPALHARERGFSRVVALGGDGTLRSVVAVAGVPVALIPAGTTNSVARSLGIPLGIEAALELAVRGIPRPLDVGEVSGPSVKGGRAIFLLCASSGADAEVVRLYEASRRGAGSVLRYALTAAHVAVHHIPGPINVHAEGRPLVRGARLAVAANMPVYGGWFKMSPGAIPDDGLLDLVAVRAYGPCGILASVWRAFIGRSQRPQRAFFARVRQMRWESDVDTSLEIDGEPAGFLPAEVRLLPKAVEIVCTFEEGVTSCGQTCSERCGSA